MTGIIITIMALTLLMGAISFYVGVVSCMYIITGPGQTRTLTHLVSGNLYFQISYSRCDQGRGALRMRLIKK